MIKAKNYILEIDPYKPGKSKSNNVKVVKLSSNENALGSSPKAIAAYEEQGSKAFRYPDGGCNDLREALSNKYKIESDRIVCGAGSDEIIALITHAFCGVGDEILYSEYGFLMYPISAKRVGAKAVKAKEVDLTANVDNIISQISDKTKIIFLANPNNPTGSYLVESEVRRLIDNVASNILIVLDLAYAEFVDKDDYPDGVGLVNEYPNVVMMRTFSKIHGLASLRLGWSYSSPYVADVLNRARGPFNVSGAAQSAGIAAIKDESFMEKSRIHNAKWLKIVAEELDKMGIKHHPSVANFVLIDFLEPKKCQEVNQFLLDNGIILREMISYGLPNCLRMTIGNDEENELVIKLLNQFIKN